jgi:uncharacterized protein (TIGR00255 family)
MLSMTAFSSLSFSTIINSSNGPIDIDINMSLKSLNSRFFEINCKLPFNISSIEYDIIKKVKSRLHRGNVLLIININNPKLNLSSLDINTDLVSNYIKIINNLKQKFKNKIKGSLLVSDIIKLPNIFCFKEIELDKNILNLVLTNIDNLIDNLIQLRLKEGSFIKLDLLNKIAAIEEFIYTIDVKSRSLIDEKKNIIVENLENIKESTNNLEYENKSNLWYNQLDKIDINEEIVRFNSHIQNFKDVANSTSCQKGKQLDFILQELFREINTIMSKIPDSEITRFGINIKVELEKSREQIQNIV